MKMRFTVYVSFNESLHLLFFIFSDESKYDLVNYWNATGLTAKEITALYQKTVDDQLAILYIKEREKGGETINAVKKVTRTICESYISLYMIHQLSKVTVPFPFVVKCVSLNITFYLMHHTWTTWNY